MGLLEQRVAFLEAEGREWEEEGGALQRTRAVGSDSVCRAPPLLLRPLAGGVNCRWLEGVMRLV